MSKSPVSSIFMLNLNRSISDQFCVNPGCTSSDGAQFTAEYQLSLHWMFPRFFVTIQFQYAFFIFLLQVCYYYQWLNYSKVGAGTLHFLLSLRFPLRPLPLSLPLEVDSLDPARGLWKRCSVVRVCGGAPAEIEFGAF